eukprot:5467959-Amphidinium_carterae.1
MPSAWPGTRHAPFNDINLAKPRFICSNSFDSSIEPQLTGSTLDFPKFMELLSPCFPPNSNVEDVKAMLKRSNVVVVFGNHQ